MNLIPKIEVLGTEARVELAELVMPYATQDFDDWRHQICRLAGTRHDVCQLPGERAAKDALLARFPADKDGRLFGRPISVFWHQPHNWPEFMWCSYLAEDGFPLSQIVYENWRASDRSSDFISSERNGSGEYAHGTAVLRSILPETFFSGYAALIEANRNSLTHRGDPHDISVDVFAARPGEVGFFEIKRDEGTRKEPTARHQGLALALLALAAERAWPDGQRPIIRVGFVRFSDRSPAGEQMAAVTETVSLST